jgi:predicted nucleic acid-binding protein
LRAMLIDSDIPIEIAHGRHTGLLARWNEPSESDAVIACSPVTVAEIWDNARPPEYPVVNGLLTAMTCIPIDIDIGRRAGDYLRQFLKSHAVELGDALIAATASIHGLALWTRNRKHYHGWPHLFWRSTLIATAEHPTPTEFCRTRPIGTYRRGSLHPLHASLLRFGPH